MNTRDYGKKSAPKRLFDPDRGAGDTDVPRQGFAVGGGVGPGSVGPPLLPLKKTSMPGFPKLRNEKKKPEEGEEGGDRGGREPRQSAAAEREKWKGIRELVKQQAENARLQSAQDAVDKAPRIYMGGATPGGRGGSGPSAAQTGKPTPGMGATQADSNTINAITGGPDVGRDTINVKDGRIDTPAPTGPPIGDVGPNLPIGDVGPNLPAPSGDGGGDGSSLPANASPTSGDSPFGSEPPPPSTDGGAAWEGGEGYSSAPSGDEGAAPPPVEASSGPTAEQTGADTAPQREEDPLQFMGGISGGGGGGDE